MFTDKAQTIVDLAKDYAFSNESADLHTPAVVAALGHQPESAVLLAECLNVTPDRLRVICPPFGEPEACPGKLPLAASVRSMLGIAKRLAQNVPDRLHPGLIDLRHLVAATMLSAEACAVLGTTPLAEDAVSTRLASWYDRDAQSPRLDELTERLRRLRTELLAKVFGQGHAVQAFVEGLFNAEVVAAADTQRKRPRALFVFAGPPGVGKTYLAELGASYLDRPFKRFDMSAYSTHQQDEALVGMNKGYRGAHPGQLTEFVEKNPSAVLLFDEIEKSHLNTINLFLQILDAGTLEDKYYERNMTFRDTTIIFTSNAGRKLYEQPNASGVHGANAAFHRRTILDALESERDPRTGEPVFPAAICSRLATGYPVLFNHLGVSELEQVARAELTHVAGLMQLQYYKRVSFDDLLPVSLVPREGANVDARTLGSQTAAFLKTELFKFCQLFKTERLDDVLDQVDEIRVALDGKPCDYERDVANLFESQDRPRVLLIADTDLTNLYREAIPEVDWQVANTAADTLELLAQKEVDMVLLDLWIGRSLSNPGMTMRQFDHVPAAARGLDLGQELLRKIRDRLPNLPVYLLSLAESEGDERGSGSKDQRAGAARAPWSGRWGGTGRFDRRRVVSGLRARRRSARHDHEQLRRSHGQGMAVAARSPHRPVTRHVQASTPSAGGRAHGPGAQDPVLRYSAASRPRSPPPADPSAEPAICPRDRGGRRWRDGRGRRAAAHAIR